MSNTLEEIVLEPTAPGGDVLTVIDEHSLHMLSDWYGGSSAAPMRMQTDTLTAKHDWALPYCVWMVFGECDPNWLETFIPIIHKTSKVVWIDSAPRHQYSLPPGELNAIGELLAAGRMKIVAGGSVKERGAKFAEMMDITSMDHWKPVISINTLKQNPADGKQLVMAIAERLTTKIMRRNTVRAVGFKFLRNSLINAPLAYATNPFKPLETLCVNRPLLLVATGPSLNKQLPALRESQGLFTIVAVDTAWPILKQQGITPDFIVALDPNSIPSWSEEGLGAFTVAVTDLNCSPELVWSNLSHRVFSCSSAGVYNFAHMIGANAFLLPSGGSVATQAFNLAVSMGANPIILIGQDLALTGGKDHAEGYLFKYDSKQLDSRSKAGYDVPGYHGGTVRTERQLLAYKTWYEQRISSLPNLTVINSTEGGARIEGALQIPFELVCQEIRKTSLRKPSIPLSETASLTGIEAEHLTRLIQNLDQLMILVKELLSLTMTGLKLSRRSAAPSSQQVRKLARIDQINQKIRKVDESVKLIVGVFGVVEYETISKAASRSENKLAFSEEMKYYDQIYRQMNRSAHLVLDFLAQVRSFYVKLLQEKSFDIRLLHETFGRQCEKLNVFDQTAK